MSLTIDCYRNPRATTHIRQISILPHCVLYLFTSSILYESTQIPFHFPHLSIIHRVMRYPQIPLTRLTFSVLVLLDHFFFFRHFSSFPPPRSHVYSRFSTTPNMSSSEMDIPTFGQVAAFFGICIWLVPFGLFVSLSAGELVLPTIGSDGRISPGVGGGDSTAKRGKGLVKQVYAALGNWIWESLQALGWGGGMSGGYIGRYNTGRY